MLTGVQIALSAPLTPMQLLIGAVALITAFLIVSARYQTDADHRAETYVISLGGTILLVLLVFFYGVTSLPGGRSPALTIDEYISLADRSKTIGNLDHSIALLEEAQSQFSSDDVRYARLQSRIDQLKRSQVDDACREAECRAA